MEDNHTCQWLWLETAMADGDHDGHRSWWTEAVSGQGCDTNYQLLPNSWLKVSVVCTYMCSNLFTFEIEIKVMHLTLEFLYCTLLK